MLTNIGDYLRSERRNKKLSLESVEKDTRIRKKNLKAIEDGKWDEFPSRTYIQGIIASYGRYLDLDDKKLIAYFRREYEARDKVYFKQKTDKESFNPQTKKIAKIFIYLIIGAFIIYFGYQIKTYFSHPKVTIIEPAKTTFSREKKITLKGKTDKDAIIYINKKRVYPNDVYVFETQIPLTEKKNQVTIEVTGANGQKTVIKKVFIREDKP